MSWPRVFLKLRRALFETNWEQIMEGVRRYARYCQEAGTEGSAFVVTPARFFEDEIYLEELSFCAPQSKEEAARAERKRQEAERMDRAIHSGNRLGLRPVEGECASAFETRIYLASHAHRGTDGRGDGSGAGGSNAGDQRLANRVADLASRMRIAK